MPLLKHDIINMCGSMEVDFQAILISTLEEENDLQVPAVLFRYPLSRRLPEPQYLKFKHFSCRQMNSVYPVSHSTDLPHSLDWSEKKSESSFCCADYCWETVRGPPRKKICMKRTLYQVTGSLH